MILKLPWHGYGEKKIWKPWLENREVQIRKAVDSAGWRYIKIGLNPTNVPTRMSSEICELFDSCWFQDLLSFFCRLRIM